MNFFTSIVNNIGLKILERFHSLMEQMLPGTSVSKRKACILASIDSYVEHQWLYVAYTSSLPLVGLSIRVFKWNFKRSEE